MPSFPAKAWSFEHTRCLIYCQGGVILLFASVQQSTVLGDQHSHGRNCNLVLCNIYDPGLDQEFMLDGFWCWPPVLIRASIYARECKNKQTKWIPSFSFVFIGFFICPFFTKVILDLLISLHIGKQQHLGTNDGGPIVQLATLAMGFISGQDVLYSLQWGQPALPFPAPPVTQDFPPSLIPLPWQLIPDTKRKVYSWAGRWKINNVRGRIWRQNDFKNKIPWMKGAEGGE